MEKILKYQNINKTKAFCYDINGFTVKEGYYYAPFKYSNCTICQCASNGSYLFGTCSLKSCLYQMCVRPTDYKEYYSCCFNFCKVGQQSEPVFYCVDITPEGPEGGGFHIPKYNKPIYDLMPVSPSYNIEQHDTDMTSILPSYDDIGHN